MNVSEAAEKLGAKVLSGSAQALSRVVSGGYCGDLLSWVMGGAEPDCAWVTIMSNPNVAAVAHLAGVACVVLAEGVSPDEGLLSRCADEDIPILSSPGKAFDICGMLYGELSK